MSNVQRIDSIMLLEDYIGIEKSKALSGLTPTILISIVISSAITVLVLSTHFPIDTLLLWLLSVFFMVFFRWLTSRKFIPKEANKTNYQNHLNLVTFWSFITGLNWGCLAFLFYDPEMAVYSIYLICVLAGYISIAGASGAPHLPAFLTFSIPPVSLFFLRFITAPGVLYLALAVGAVIYLFVMTLLTRVMHRNFILAKTLEHENQSLLLQVTEQKNLAETAVIEKNNFLAATSHDLRQPLQAMNLYIDALQSRLVEPTNVSILEKISLSGGALNDLLHGLLDISRLDASVIENRPQHIKLSNLANDLNDEFMPQAMQSQLQLVINVDQQHIIYVDPILLERVLRNLLSNAIKYTNEGQVILSSASVNDEIHITVSDTGIGIAADKLTTIFTEFVQIDNPERDRSKGLGLGLSIVKRLCDLQNIDIVFESQLHQGTQVLLKVMPGDKALLPITKSSTNNSFECLNILCVDDEELIRDGMGMIISSWRSRAIIASDETTALEAISKLDVQIDLIISDLRLRDHQSGVSVIQSIREELNEDVPAIIVTGDTSVDRIELVRDAKNVTLIHKPIKPVDLREAIERLLDK